MTQTVVHEITHRVPQMRIVFRTRTERGKTIDLSMTGEKHERIINATTVGRRSNQHARNETGSVGPILQGPVHNNSQAVRSLGLSTKPDAPIVSRRQFQTDDDFNIPVLRWVLAFVLGVIASGAVAAANADTLTSTFSQDPGSQEGGMINASGPAVAEVVVRDSAGRVIKRSVRTDREIDAKDPLIDTLVRSARDYLEDYREMAEVEGITATRAEGISLRGQITSICGVQLEIADNKNDFLMQRCVDARQSVDRALGDLREQ